MHALHIIVTGVGIVFIIVDTRRRRPDYVWRTELMMAVWTGFYAWWRHGLWWSAFYATAALIWLAMAYVNWRIDGGSRAD